MNAIPDEGHRTGGHRFLAQDIAKPSKHTGNRIGGAGPFELHVVCDWIGNSRAVAMKHYLYLQIIDNHFDRAVDEIAAVWRRTVRNGQERKLTNPCKRRVLLSYAAPCRGHSGR